MAVVAGLESGGAAGMLCSDIIMTTWNRSCHVRHEILIWHCGDVAYFPFTSGAY